MTDISEIKEGEKGAWLSIVAYIALSGIKVTVGYLYSSEALFADGINNMTDIVASIAVLVGLRISQKPPDEDHPYGHFRAETVASLIASFIMAAVGIQVLIQTIQSLWHGKESSPDIVTAWVALFSAACMALVYLYNHKLAKKVNSLALMSAAADNRSDALVSIGAAIGIFGTQFGLPWLDPVGAIIVGLIICKTAWGIFKEATHSLTDGFDRSKLLSLTETIEKTKGVKSVKDIKARFYGSKVIVDLVVLVDENLSLVEGHQISDEIERSMTKKHNIMNVHVHVEPYQENSE
ncbi:cation diffusion facilitator family transporter [Paenibacillus sp. J22TS3]|uniref:cation diffusion facilitator family transporter n=1 Tax=Paenibacillus sp. J22TS3 TaxID=2807192 RepID=UPI001B0240A4|nr:cation diffusion facilitator family transporter [Paenibacillus sp. J22TS3]GIP22674.1 putative transporter YeaB [Paenibacillus sp. J22TS3]